MSATDKLEELFQGFGVAASITTTISLAALAVLAAFFVVRTWLQSQTQVARDAIASGDNDRLSTVMSGIPLLQLDQLDADQKFDLAREQLRTRAKARLVGYALAFFAFIALLGFVLLLLAPAPGEAEPRRQATDLDVVVVLSRVHPGQRMDACQRLRPQDQCERLLVDLAAIAWTPSTAAQREVVDNILETGTVTTGEIQDIAACGGKFEFVIRDHRLFCSDGTPVPFVASPNAANTRQSYSALIVHSTMSPSFEGVRRLFVSSDQKVSVHVLISRSGAVLQLVPFDKVAFHAGRGTWRGLTRMNVHSIGLELVNQGMVRPLTDGEFQPAFGSRTVPAKEVGEFVVGGNREHWQRFSIAQMAAIKGIARALVRTYGIEAIVGHSDIDPNRRDPGPAFPMDEVKEAAGVQ